MRNTLLPSLAGLAIVVATTSLVSAQTVPTRTLARPEARLEQEWSRIISLRELPNGGLIVVDDLENAIMMVDSRLSTRRRIGREGPGPAEYHIPKGVLPLGGDSTGLLDDMARTLKYISPEGEIVGTVRLTGGRPCSAREDAGYRPQLTTQIDGQGRFYELAMNTQRAPDGTTRRAIERWGAGCGRDTVGYVPAPAPPPGTVGPGGAVIARANLAPVPSGQIQWFPALDGRVYIVHPEPYRVDVVLPNGTLVAGQPIRYQPIRPTQAHRNAWIERLRQPAVGVGNAGVRAVRSLPFQESDNWPRVLPPFIFDALSVGLDGRLWVQRTAENPHLPTFDVFDTAGRPVEHVVLPVRSRLVGHGRDVVYLVRIDEDDLEYLERHRVR